MSAASAGPGHGATFVVNLPLRVVLDVGPARREHPTTGGYEPHGPQILLSGLKVLVVDDESDARELLEYLLTAAGAEVATAGSASEGADLVGYSKFHVIVSDIGMPKRDGYDFIRDVRALPADRGGKTPAIALTAFARSEDRTRAMLAGFQAHIAKPIEAQELVATIKSLAANNAT